MTDLTSAERALVEELIDTGATAVRQGLVQATGGNLSARTPGGDRFVVTGAATRLDRLTKGDFALVAMDGTVLSGPCPSSEWKLHQRTYQVRDDATAIVHVHPQHAVLLDALGLPIRFLTLDHAYYVGSAGRVPFYANGTDQLADEAAEQAREHDAVVLANHGCSAVGDSVLMAFRRASLLEEAATMTYRALLLGDRDTTFGEGIELIHA